MLTKREFAEMIVEEFCESEGILRPEAHNHIFKSSRLAVALEFLGELSGIDLQYSQTRNGTEYRKIILTPTGAFEDLHFLSTREMLDLLPNTI